MGLRKVSTAIKAEEHFAGLGSITLQVHHRCDGSIPSMIVDVLFDLGGIVQPLSSVG